MAPYFLIGPLSLTRLGMNITPSAPGVISSASLIMVSYSWLPNSGKNFSLTHSRTAEPIMSNCGFHIPRWTSASIMRPSSNPIRFGLKESVLTLRISHVPLESIFSSDLAPEPAKANCVSCPPATTGVPDGMPHFFSAFSVMSPTIWPGSYHSVKKPESKPASSSIELDQSLFPRSIAIMVEALVGSMWNLPVSLCAINPGIISHVWASWRACGAFLLSQIILSRVLNEMIWYPVIWKISQADISFTMSLATSSVLGHCQQMGG